LSLALRFKQLR